MKMLKLPDIENTVVKCFNGKEVVDLVASSIEEGDPHRYGLIITDCSMPILDGYEECEQIRALLADLSPSARPQLQIIAVTGHVEKEFLKKAELAGMNCVYSKPLQL